MEPLVGKHKSNEEKLRTESVHQTVFADKSLQKTLRPSIPIWSPLRLAKARSIVKLAACDKPWTGLHPDNRRSMAPEPQQPLHLYYEPPLFEIQTKANIHFYHNARHFYLEKRFTARRGDHARLFFNIVDVVVVSHISCLIQINTCGIVVRQHFRRVCRFPSP